MKTALDISRDYPGTSPVTRGQGNVYTCHVSLPGGDYVIGMGTTLASAEDTAWHAVKFTLQNP